MIVVFHVASVAVLETTNFGMPFIRSPNWRGPSEVAAAVSAVATEVARVLRALELHFVLSRPAPSPATPAPFPPLAGN